MVLVHDDGMTSCPPARNLLRRQYGSYGDFSGGIQLDIHQEKASVISNIMEDEGPRSDEVGGKEEAGASSKDGDERDEGWLQLGIGSRLSGYGRLGGGPTDTSSGEARRRGHVMDVNLCSDRPPDPHLIPAPVTMPLLPPVAAWYPREALWGINNLNPMSSASTTGHNWVQSGRRSGSPGPAVASGEDMRVVVSPPPRPQIGMWFVLRAAENQEKEPSLPQISKSYLRIKDGRMTVKVLMKYLAKKLGLENESEVEISCRGQLLPPFLTLEHARDSVWCSRPPTAAVPSDSTSIDHLMILQYSRREYRIDHPPIL